MDAMQALARKQNRMARRTLYSAQQALRFKLRASLDRIVDANIDMLLAHALEERTLMINISVVNKDGTPWTPEPAPAESPALE